MKSVAFVYHAMENVAFVYHAMKSVAFFELCGLQVIDVINVD